MEPPKTQINLDILPPETITGILLNLKLPDLLNFCKTSHYAMEYCKSDQFWKAKYKHDFPNLPPVGNNKVVSWNEQYKLAYSVPNSPVSMGIGHFAVIDNQNMLYMGGDSHQYNDSDIKKLSKISPFKQKVRSVSCGNFFTGAVTEDGRVFFWGERLGFLFGKNNSKIPEPREFPIPARSAGVLPNKFEELPSRAIKIVCGPKVNKTIDAMFAVILEDRSVFLKMNYISKHFRPWKISTRLNIKAKDISTNGYSLAIVSTDGKLYYLGENLEHRPRNDIGIVLKGNQIIINPVHIPLPGKIKQVSLGLNHIGVISEKGEIFLWGSNEFGQLGQGWKEETENDIRGDIYVNSHIEPPQELWLPTPISFLFCQDTTTAVIDENGELYRWGWNGGFIRLTQDSDPDEITSQKLRLEFTDIIKYRIIPSPIQIGIELSENHMIENRFKYVAIGTDITITTTTDGWVNIWSNRD